VANSTVAESPVLAPDIVSEPDEGEEEAPLTEELLVEEISIDGMCGVY
jgi:mycofactocin precursor